MHVWSNHMVSTDAIERETVNGELTVLSLQNLQRRNYKIWKLKHDRITFSENYGHLFWSYFTFHYIIICLFIRGKKSPSQYLFQYSLGHIKPHYLIYNEKSTSYLLVTLFRTLHHKIPIDSNFSFGFWNAVTNQHFKSVKFQKWFKFNLN